MTAAGNDPMSIVVQGAALVSFIWSCTVFVVQSIGIYQILRSHSAPGPPPASTTSVPDNEIPHITIIRPVKGIEVGLYECLASTFQLAYPKSKFTIHLCVSTADDPAYPVLQQLRADFPDIDARIFVEDDDPLLHGADGHVNNLGPNPKIRNMSRAYREAKGDLIWIVDCNIWVGSGSAARMVDKLCGFRPNGERATPYKLVHQLPLVLDIENASSASSTEEEHGLLPKPGATDLPRAQHNPPRSRSLLGHGGRLEEMFMATSHAKFYCAINTVSIAPCTIGKSNMFRKSHLDRFTDPAANPLLSASDSTRGRGLDFFSSYICEDHLLGDLIWRSQLSPATGDGAFNQHGLVFGEPVIQPIAGMSVSSYVARRVRWLRVRKWTVLAATLVEPGIEPFLCSLHVAFALTSLPWARDRLFGSPDALLSSAPPTWGSMAGIWLFTVTAWMLLDWWFSTRLGRLASVEVDSNTPGFAMGSSRRGGVPRRPFLQFLGAWLGRESLALPIWTWAVLLGTTVDWRGKKFQVRMDMSVVECDDGNKGKRKRTSAALSVPSSDTSRPSSRNKDRVD
ncbi:glycosyltransferase family 21 protein [Chaetomium sp. MPI-SDFR-AT-0129]|nr:glycosyltransferase family 21 protein [Chaetomium sp. MPI-SDFR-AT-0129]